MTVSIRCDQSKRKAKNISGFHCVTYSKSMKEFFMAVKMKPTFRHSPSIRSGSSNSAASIKDDFLSSRIGGTFPWIVYSSRASSNQKQSGHRKNQKPHKQQMPNDVQTEKRKKCSLYLILRIWNVYVLYSSAEKSCLKLNTNKDNVFVSAKVKPSACTLSNDHLLLASYKYYKHYKSY